MSMKLDIQWFIEQNPDWESVLAEKPYCISVIRDVFDGRKLMILKYSQIDSDFSLRIVRECRGIILDEDTNEVVSYAFDKFGNVGESYCPKIDSSSMKSTVKIDGSIIKIRKFKDGSILISTNGTIDAYKAPVADQFGCGFESFGDIVEDVIVHKFGTMQLFSEHIDSDKTYIFEMVSPWTRVVTPFEENDMYLIGCRSIDPESGFSEIPFWECGLGKWFKTPGILDFSSIDRCLEYAQTLDWTNEGFVVMDKDFNRVKVKNAAWLAVHHLANNGVMSYERAIEIVRSNEVDEVVSYFPNFKDALFDAKAKYENLCSSIDCSFARMASEVDSNASRKEKAMWIQKNFVVPGAGFCLLDGKVSSGREWVDACHVKNLCKLFGYKD